MELFAGTIIADRFRLEREIGRGGMGAVWLARHVGLDIPCAIKFILSSAAKDPELCARFEREAKAAAHIRSPNVVQILDYGIWQGTPYIAMELLEGEDLDARLARLGRLDARATASIIGQVARALGKAHAMGVVHRDIKPSNIFLVRDEDREIAKVLDFGIAKSYSAVIGEGHTRAGALLGTPHFMSPEQMLGNRAVDHRSDLWALGVLAYLCLTGQLPFESDGLGELALQIMERPTPIPSRIADVPPGFDAWWARAVARDPARRFQSARELAESLFLALGISAAGYADLRDSGPPPGPLVPAGRTEAQSSTPPTPVGAVLPATPAPHVHGRRRAVIAVIATAALVLGSVVAVVGLPRVPLEPAERAGGAVMTAAAAAVASAERPPIARPAGFAEAPITSAGPIASSSAAAPHAQRPTRSRSEAPGTTTATPPARPPPIRPPDNTDFGF